MDCKTTLLKARLATKIEQLEKLNTELDDAIENMGIESYSLDTGNGKQATKRRDPNDIQKLIEKLEKDIDAIYRKLRGTGLMYMTTSRRCY